jgi:hypothetical protein
MSRKPSGAERKAKLVRIWTYDQIRNAAPYIKSVLASIREHQLEAQAQLSRAVRLEASPGRSDRDRLIALAEARQAGARAREARGRDEEELNAVDVFCLDPIRGEAVVPFVEAKQLAWYFFDLFEDNPVRFWRFQNDDETMRRPIVSPGTVQV